VVDTRKALALVALLAVTARPFARDELAAMFWPEADDDASRGSLRRTLSALRSGLGGRGIAIDRSQVGLDPAAVSLDLSELERLERSTRRDELEEAAGLVRGPFLAGFNLRDSPAFDDWLTARASTVERTVAGVLDRLASLQARDGDVAAALATARRRLELDPLDEPAQRRVIGLLADAGDRSAAIRQYRACVTVLDRELGVAPLAETVALVDSIRDGTFRAPDRAPHPALAHDADQARTATIPMLSPHDARLPFVGREAELEAIREQYRAVATDGRIVVVDGEPGIGKTRLLEEVAAELGRGGAEVLLSRAWAAESGIAYAPVADVLRQSFGREDALERLTRLPDAVRRELGRLVALPPLLQPAEVGRSSESLDPSLARSRLLDALAMAVGAILAGPKPGVLAVDDLHFADASTLELVAWLLRRLEGRPFLFLLSWCSEDLPVEALPVAGLAESRPEAALLRLRRLGRVSVSELLAGLARSRDQEGVDTDVDALLEASEGLPIDLAERLARHEDHGTGVLDSSGHARPHGFRALLRDRLSRVRETAAQVLAAGAVIGRSFDLPTVRAASGRSEDETVTALDELVRRGLIRESTADGELRFDFVHASLREAAIDGISQVRRRLLHKRVAEALQSGFGRTAAAGDLGRLVLIAQHERDAGRTAESAEAFRIAAEGARRVYANREAIELVDAAIALGHPNVGRLQRLLGELRLGLGEYALAIAAFEAAAAEAADLDLAELELFLARAHARRGDLTTAVSHLNAGLVAIGDPGDAGRHDAGAAAPSLQLLVRILVERGVVALQARDPDAAARAATEALALASRLGDSTTTGRAHRILGLVARSRGDVSTARAELERSLDLAAADPDPGSAIAAANALALVEAAAGDPSAAIGHLEAALAEARRIGERHLEAAIENNLADGFHAIGDTERSLEHLRRAVAIFAEIGGRPTELEPEIWKLQSW
jgi:DNA-binding SARP family transcriptional activator